MSNPELSELSVAERNGEKLFRRGVVVYYLLCIFPLFFAQSLIDHPFGIAGVVALSICILVAPAMAARGSDGWKHFAGAMGLLVAMGSFSGGCAMAEEKTRHIGIVSLGVFLLSCYVVKVFLINQDVKDCMPVLRKRRMERMAGIDADKTKSG